MEQAFTLMKESLGTDNPRTQSALQDLAIICWNGGNLEAALRHLQEYVTLSEQAYASKTRRQWRLKSFSPGFDKKCNQTLPRPSHTARLVRESAARRGTIAHRLGGRKSPERLVAFTPNSLASPGAV